MAENNELGIQVGVVLDTSDIKSQLEAISKGKYNQIKLTADTSEAKKTIKELKDELKNSKSPAKIAIDVLKGQSNTNIGNYVKEIQEKYQSNPIKITLDVDKNATTANINKAVGEMQQQVQKAVDQAAKINNVNTNIVAPGAEVQIIDNNQLKESIKNLEEVEGLAKRITNYSWTQTEDGISSLQATSQIEKYNEALGKTVTVYKEIDKEQSELAGWDIFKETGQSIQENFERVEKLEQQTMNYFSKLQTEYNKMQSSISGQGNPLIGDYAQKATEALEKYRDEYTKVMNAGSGATDEQKRNIEELRQQTLLVIKEQRSLQKAYEDTLITVQKQQNALETTYAKAFDKNATKTLFFEDGDATNKKFAEPVIEQYEKIKTLLSDIENNARNNGLAITTEQTNQLTEAFAKLNIVISEQKNARWTATNFKETDTASFVERYKNMMVELSNALKDDGVYDKFQTKISQLFTTLNSVKFGDASTGDFLNQLRNIKQEINTFESSVKGQGIMAAFDISEDQLVRIKSLGKALNGQENTQGIENLKQKLADLGKAYEELQIKVQAKGISRDRLNNLETEQKALDKELQSINSMVNNLGNESWVNSQNAGIADMKAKFAEYREEITKTVQLTPELDERLKALAQAMSESGKVDVTNWKDYNNEIKTLKANIEEYKNSIQGQASQLAISIDQNQIEQIEKALQTLYSLDGQYEGAGVKKLREDLQGLEDEYNKLIEKLNSDGLTDDQFKRLNKEAKELDEQLKRLTKEASVFGNQNSLDKFTASANGLKLNLERLEKQYSSLIAKNPEFASRVDELKQKLESLQPGEIPAISKEISNLGKEMASASGQSAGLRGALQDAFGGLGSYIARFASSYYLISKTIQGVKKMVSAVKEVDTSLVELQKVTNLTGDSLTSFTDKAYEMGAQLGRTGKDVIDAATTFSRAGYDLNEATQLAQSALVMTNVGVDIPNMESAASDMISILKAFDIQAEESMDVIDKLYNVANKEPLDFGNITQMLVTAGGTLAQTGTSIEETMGLLTGAFATMRDESVSNGLIMISQRLRGLSEDGEAIDGLIPKLQSLFSSVGINIEDQNGQLRSTFDILNDLAAVWDQLSSKQRQYFGEKVAGNRQVKTLNAIMQNWDVVADTIDKANNAQGEALKGNEMYMDSIEGRMTQLQSAFQELARTTIDSDLVKNITSAGTEVIKLATSAGGLVPILTTIIGLIVAIKGAKIAEGLGKIWTAFSTLFTGMSSGLSLATGWVGVLIAVAGAVAMIVAHTNEANSALKKFEEAKESYEEHKSKVEGLNDELKTTQDRISELEAKEHLTIIEQKELDRLKEVNTQLQTQIGLEEKLAEIAQGQARDAATKAIEEENRKRPVTSKTGDQIRKEISKNLTDDIIQNIVADSWKTMPLFSDELSYAPTNEEQVRLRIEAIKQDYAELVKIQEQIANLKPGHAAMKDELDAESDAIAENIKKNKEALSDYYNWLENKTEGIDYVKDAKLGSQEARYNELLDFKKAIGDALLYEDAFNPPINDEAFNKVLSRYPEAIKEMQDQLKEASSEGWELDIPEDLAQELMSKFDLTMDEVKQIFKEKYGEGSNGLQLDIGPQMNINMEDVIGKLYQTTDGYTKVLSKALSEQEKAGSLTAETLEKVMGESGLQGVADCLEKTANGYRLNTERVNEYISAQNEDIRLNAIAGIMERQIAIDNLTASMQYLSDAEWEAAENQVADWENEIIQLQAVADQAIIAADALDELREASKTADEDADHTDASKRLKNTKEMYEVGKVGTDDFRKGMDYLLGEGWYEQFNGDIDKAFKAFEAKREKFFADDDADSANNFMDALVGKGLATRDKASGEFNLLTDDITKVADALGISETAAQDLFELLNSYSFDNKFVFGDDALDSADKIAVAQNKLEEIDEQRTQKMKELEEAQKELNKATDEETRKQKAAEIKELNGQLDELNEQYNNLSTAIDTANKAMDEGMETPKTLEDALKQIQDYQQAITTLETNGIKPTVELQGDADTLTSLLSNPATTLTVNAEPGNIDDQIKDLEAFKKSMDEDPSITAEIKTLVDGTIDAAIEGLKKYNEEVKEVDGHKYVQSKITITPFGIKQATIEIQGVKEEAEELDKTDPTVNISAEADKDSIDGAKAELKLPSPEELTAIYMADKDDKSIKTVSDLLDNLGRDREVTFKPKTNEELWAEWEPRGHRMTNEDWDRWNQEADKYYGSALNNQGMITFTPEVDKTAFGKDFEEALKGAAENADPVSIVPTMDDEDWDKWSEEVDDAFDHPFDIEAQVNKDNISGQVQEGIEQGAENAEPDIKVGTDGIEESITSAVEGMPDVNAPVGVDSENLVEKIKNLIKNTKLNDLIVNVKQKVSKADTAAPKDVNQTVNVRGKDAGATKTIQDVGKEAQKGATMPIDADPKEANKEVKSLTDRIKEKVFKPIGIAFGDAYRQLIEAERRLAQTVYKRVEVTYVEKNNPPQAAKGTKNAKGGLTLVDEKGAELIEHTKQGTYELGTNSGARFANLDKGDIVHTADETRKILSRMGNVSGLIKGSFNAIRTFIGDAFAAGTVRQTGPTKIKPKKKKEDTKTKSTKTSGGSKSGSSGSSSSGSSSSSSNDEMSKWTDWAKDFFDWAEIKLNRLKEATKSFTEEAARAVGVWKKNRIIESAMDSVEDEIEANKQAYKEYINTANEVLSHANKLTNDMVSKIIAGTIDVTRYDDVTQQQIKDYQTWYEKAKACLDTVEQLKQQQKELGKQRLQNIVDAYSGYAKYLETEEGIGAARRDYLESIGEATTGTSIADRFLDKNGNINIYDNLPKEDQEIFNPFEKYAESIKTNANAIAQGNGVLKKSVTESEELILEYEEWLDEFDDYLDSFSLDLDITEDDLKLVTHGDIIDISALNREYGNAYGSFSDEIYSSEAKKRRLSEEKEKLEAELNSLINKGTIEYGDDVWFEYTNKIKELEKEVYQTAASIERLKDAANDAALTPFRNQLEEFRYEASKQNQEMDLGNLKGSLSRGGKEKAYQDLIKSTSMQNRNLEVQNILYRQLQEGLNKNSQKYQDFEKKIRDNEAAMLSNKQALEQYKQAIIQLGFDKVEEDFNNLTIESEKLNDAISIKMLKGIEITESAYKSLINNGNAQISNLKKQRDAYQRLMDQLVKQYGAEAKTSDLYLQYKSQVDSLDSSIRDLDSSIIQWNKDMQNLAVEKVGWQLDSLKNTADNLNDAISLKKAKGQALDIADYQRLIDNARSQNELLNQQNSLYAKQQVGMDKNSQAYQELQSKIDSNSKSIRNNLVSIEQWDDAMKNLSIEEMSHKIDQLKTKNEEYNDIIKKRELDGQRITAAYYQSMINNANEEISVLNSQKNAYQALMNELTRLYGSAALESDVYKDYEKSLDGVNKEIRSLTSSTREWQIAIEELPIEELGWQLDALKETFDKISNLKSLNEAQSIDLTSQTYSDLINNGMERIKLLEEENKLLKARQKNMDINSKAYQELQQQIAANNNEIAGIKVSQEEWNDSIVDIGIKNIQRYRDSMSKSNDQLQKQKELQEALLDLERADSQRKVRTYVEGQGFVYQRDEDEFRKAQENLEDVIRNQLMDKLDDLIDALEESKKDTNVYDKNGNLLGSVYNTPQIGYLTDVLTKYYNDNKNALIDMDVLKDALGKDVISNINPQNNQTSFTIGDITINEVKDGNELAQAIIDQFPNALLQAMYKH